MQESHQFPVIVTERLILRELTPKDLEFYHHHFNIREIIDGCAFPGPENLETAREELELYCLNSFREGKGARWGIVLKDIKELVGTCGIYGWNKIARRAEIGYDLDPKQWGKGIMTEALRAILRYGFEEMNLNRIQAIIDTENNRSLNLALRLGFRNEGVLRQRTQFKGGFRDDAIYSLLKQEWINGEHR